VEIKINHVKHLLGQSKKKKTNSVKEGGNGSATAFLPTFAPLISVVIPSPSHWNFFFFSFVKFVCGILFWLALSIS